MAAPVIAVIAKKAATILLTDKRTWTVIGSVIGGIVAFVIIAVTVIFGGISAQKTAEKEADEAVKAGISKLFSDEELPENLPAAYRDGIEKIKAVLKNVEAEISNQGLDTDPVKAQMILLCALTDRMDAPPYDAGGGKNFYTEYISCFVGAENDEQIFDRISEKFSVELRAEDRAHILALYQNALESLPAPTESGAENQSTP